MGYDIKWGVCERVWVSRCRFPHGLADAADESGRKGSSVYEIDQWLWQFGRGKPRLGGLSVAETEEWRISVTVPGRGSSEEGNGYQGPKTPQGSQGGRAPGRTGIGYP